MSISKEYRIKEEFGNQSKRKFGKTYLVEGITKDEKAVLKTIKKTPKNKHLIQRVIDEATFSFNTKGLPTVLSIENLDSEVSLLLEYKDGITIDEYWKSVKKRNRHAFLINFLEKLQPIFETLEKEKIVHCDLKPSNLLIQPNDDGFDVHLIDFGMAVRKNEINPRSLLFPLGYAAPELLLNHLELLNQTTDIFALGNVFWRLYTGKLPLTHPNPSIFTNLQLTHPLPEHTSIPNKVFQILKKMANKHQFKIPPNKMNEDEVKLQLALARDSRYQDIPEILTDLKEIKRFYQIKSFR